MWIRRENALLPIVPPKTFAKAQEIIAERRKALSDNEALERLADLRAREGHLSAKLILEAKDVPSCTTLIRRFGSITAAYKHVGFRAAERYHWLETETRMRALIEAAIAEMIAQLAYDRIQASFDAKEMLLKLGDRDVTVTIGHARCLCEGEGGKRWRVKTDRNATTLLTLIFQMDETNTSFKDYYLLPTFEIGRTRVKRFRMTTRVFSNSRLKTLGDVVNALKAAHRRLQP